ncbi:MAG: hypothetical protein P1R58_06200 [bacterium]|nr:hypothetical protein [bacterium]
MSRRSKRLILLSLVVTALTLYIGCTQPEDVLKKVTNTYIFVENVQNLPSSQDHWRYEVWVADAKDTISAGKFAYSQPLRRFSEVDGTARADTNRFLLNSDFLSYDKIFVSVEPYPDPDPTSPSAIMLIDLVNLPEDDNVRLVFPEIADTIPLWSAICRFSMETVSDDSTYIKDGFLKPFINTRQTSTNGYGLWFANYQRRLDSLRDTVAGVFIPRTDRVDTIGGIGSEGDTIITSLADITNLRVDTIIRRIGLDSFIQTVVRFDSILFVDSTNPYVSKIPDSVFFDSVKNAQGAPCAITSDFFYTTVPAICDTPRTMSIDTFTQDNFRLPNFAPYGWEYKGWVVSPLIDTSAGYLTPPGWGRLYNDTATGDIIIPGDYGGLLTTGTFGWINQPDDSNLYTKTNRVPAFPGDEFFFNLPAGLDSVNLVPYTTGNTGTVFITLEPKDLSSYANRTNFPLFVMTRPMPSNRSEVTADNQQFTMRNRTGNVIADQGFPSVEIKIHRF